MFEADNRSRKIYRISDTEDRLIEGYDDMALWHGQLPTLGPYAALVDFYDDSYRGDTARVAVLLQPVAMQRARTMAMVQVAETLELRRTLARQILFDTLWRQLALISVIALVVDNAPHELRPLLDATNTTMRRLHHLLENQKRFVRDTAYQLRTPLAVLKVQVQSALRGDVEAHQGLREINHTVERAAQLANQMLALAKVAKLAQEHATESVDWVRIVREVALDLAPLIADKALDFEIDTLPAPIRTHAWMLRELSRNLLHNAIRYRPEHGELQVRLLCDASHAALVISDNGPGINDELRKRLFLPFSAGLGLAICPEITHTLGGQIELVNRSQLGQIDGFDTTARLPLATSTTEVSAKP